MFDPNFHQAVMREESTVLPENEIIEEMQRGYTFKDRLLRPSMVKVAVAPAATAADEPEASAEVAETDSEAAE
jgi:molecular chaperone GrpE